MTKAECVECGISAQTPPDLRSLLYNKVIEGPPGDVLEIGSARGGTTIFLIGAAQEVGKQVWSVDPYPKGLVGIPHYNDACVSDWKIGFKKNILYAGYHNIVQIRRNITECHQLLPVELSLIFIDGMHDGDYLKNDYDLTIGKLVPGGWMFIDDAEWEEGPDGAPGQMGGPGCHDISARLNGDEFTNVITICGCRGAQKL